MHTFQKLLLVQIKLYLREPMSVFFTLLLGPVLVLLIGAVFGNQPDPLFAGLGNMDVSVPAYIAVIIGISAFTTVPVTTTTRREKGVLRRFSATPLRPLTYFASDMLVHLIMAWAGILLLVLTGRLFYNVHFAGNLLAVIGGVLLASGAFFALGYALAGLAPSTQAAIVTGNVVVIPMMFLSGAYIPMEVMPAGVQKIARFLPVTHIVTLMRGLWSGGSWRGHVTEIGVLGAILVVGIIGVTRTFRWS